MSDLRNYLRNLGTGDVVHVSGRPKYRNSDLMAFGSKTFAENCGCLPVLHASNKICNSCLMLQARIVVIRRGFLSAPGCR